MRPASSILRRDPLPVEEPRIKTPVKRLRDPSTLGAVMGTFQLRTQSVLDYLAVTLLKTW